MTRAARGPTVVDPPIGARVLSLGGVGSRVRWGRRVLGVFLGVSVLYLVAATAPHLVHHLLDADEGAECPFLAVAHHAPAAVGAPALGPGLLPAGDAPVVVHVVFRPILRDARPPARGPPAVSLATT